MNLSSSDNDLTGTLKLPIVNRLLSWRKAITAYVVIGLLPIFVSFSNPTNFNLWFTAIMLVPPLPFFVFYLRKNNVENAFLKEDSIVIEMNNNEITVSLEEIKGITQMLAPYASRNLRFVNLYEIQHKSKQKFGYSIYLEMEAMVNLTVEHALVNEIKRRAKLSSGGISS